MLVERDAVDRVAVGQADGRELAAGEGERVAVHLGLVVGGDGQGAGRDVELAVDVGDVVVGRGQATDADRVGAQRAGLVGAGHEDRRAAEVSGVVAVEEGVVAQAEGRVGVAVGLGRGIDRDREVGRGDRQQGRDVDERVVLVGPAATGDGVGPDVAGLVGQGRAAREGRQIQRAVAVLVAGDGEGQARVGVAVDLALEDRRHGQDLGVDGQRAVRVGDGVVVETRADGGRGHDRVGARGGRGGRAGARERDAVDRVAVGQADGRELAAGEGERVAVHLGLVVGGDGQGAGRDVELAVDVGDVVVGRGQATDADRVGAQRAGLVGAGHEDRRAAEVSGVVAVEEGVVAQAEGRVGVAVGLGRGIDRDREVGRGDRRAGPGRR